MKDIVIGIAGLTMFAIAVTLLISCGEASASSDGGEAGAASSRVPGPHTSPLSPIAHCPIDINANGTVDISDVSLLTGRFGTAQTLPYDIAPELVGNGFVDISDVSMVTNHFGQACIGNTEMFADPPQTEGFGPDVWGCRSVTQGWPTGYSNGHVLVNVWGGNAFCYTDPDFAYRFECTFSWNQWNGAVWVPIANTYTAWTVGVHDYGGQFCGANGFPAWLPCNVQLLGHAQLTVRLAASGTLLFANAQPEDGFGWNVPC
jgi:hypothetical protein